MVKHQGKLTLRATAEQIRAFLETELRSMAYYDSESELDTLPFFATYSAPYGRKLDMGKFHLTEQDDKQGYVMQSWDGTTWVHMGVKGDREYGCGQLHIADDESMKRVELRFACDYTAYLPYWVWLWKALVRRFLAVKPITDALDKAIFDILAANHFEISDEKIMAQLKTKGLQIGRPNVNRRRRAMGYGIHQM